MYNRGDMAHPDIAALVQEAKARKWADRDLTQHADDLAQELLDRSQKLLTADERTLLNALTRMVEDEKNRRFVKISAPRFWPRRTSRYRRKTCTGC